MFLFSEDILYILQNFHFMLFDRYEIHIEAFLDFINGNFLSFSDPHLHKIISKHIYSFLYVKKHKNYTQMRYNNKHKPHKQKVHVFFR